MPKFTKSEYDIILIALGELEQQLIDGDAKGFSIREVEAIGNIYKKFSSELEVPKATQDVAKDLRTEYEEQTLKLILEAKRKQLKGFLRSKLGGL